MGSASPPRDARSAFARASSSALRARIATRPPCSQTFRAISKPSPREPPVISATLSLMENPRDMSISRMFAIEARNFAGSLAIDRPFFKVGAFVARDLALSDAKLGLQLPVLPIKLENDECATGHLGLAVKFVDLLSM